MAATDILGALLQGGMGQGVGQRRLDSAVQTQGGLGSMLESMLGGATGAAPRAAAGGAGGGLGDVLQSMLGGQGGAGGMLGGLLQQAQDVMRQNPQLAAGGIGALAGSLLGGGGKSMGGAMGGAALGLLGMVAMNALRASAGGPQGAAGPAPGPAPGRAAVDNQDEERAELTVVAMIEAAKADNRIDAQEMAKLVGKLEEAGVGPEGRQWLTAQLQKPMDMAGLVGRVRSMEEGAQVYAASLLAIEVDTPEERAYLQRLASALGLQPPVVRHIHDALAAETGQA